MSRFPSPADKLVLLAETLALFQRWEREGSLPYFAQHNTRETAVQYFYDTYHDRIEREADNTYSFDIQTYDSPEGDTWWEGKFAVSTAGEITILEERFYGN